MATERTRGVGEILARLRTIIEEVSLGAVPPDKIRDDSRLIEDLGLDSLDYASTLLQCEQWLGIKVREAGVDWRELGTVAKLAAFLHEQARK